MPKGFRQPSKKQLLRSFELNQNIPKSYHKKISQGCLIEFSNWPPKAQYLVTLKNLLQTNWYTMVMWELVWSKKGESSIFWWLKGQIMVHPSPSSYTFCKSNPKSFTSCWSWFRDIENNLNTDYFSLGLFSKVLYDSVKQFRMKEILQLKHCNPQVRTQCHAIYYETIAPWAGV